MPAVTATVQARTGLRADDTSDLSSTGYVGTAARRRVGDKCTVTKSERPPHYLQGERISRIDIDASPPFRINGTNIWERAGRFAAKQHVTTKESVIRRYLALQLGDRCTEVRRAESERILRAQPFIADATVLAYDDGQGGVALTVSTVDEVSLIIGAGIGGGSGVHSLLLGEDNLLGTALHAESQWRKGVHRDTYAAKVVDYQFLGRPYQLRLEGGRPRN